MPVKGKKNPDGKKLTPKQAAFVQEYLIDLNGTQAAIRAGYSGKNACIIGWENLRKPNIKDAIDQAKRERAERTKVTQDMVVSELAKLGFSNMLDYITPREDGLAYIDLSKLTRAQAACITEFNVEQESLNADKEGIVPVNKIRFKLADKKGPLELLGKHLKMFTDNVNIPGLSDLLAALPAAVKQEIAKALKERAKK
jgi:phage terminase small subunit